MMESELPIYDFNDLLLKEVLGQGGYGKVHLCNVKESNQLYAIKLFRVFGDRKKMKKQLMDAKNETNILAQLEHKNIVRIVGITQKKDEFGIILEYVPSGNLESFLHNHLEDPISWKIRLKFFTELAHAIDYLHNYESKQKYVHGDLKPQNVLLGNKLTVKVADFGATSIALTTGAHSSSSSGDYNIQYTLRYTAPEFLRNFSKRRRSMDVYSYGMIGYEILTRKLVYSGAEKNLYFKLINEIKNVQKLNTIHIDKVLDSLKSNSSESVIFRRLNEIVYECWEFKAFDRPKISEVKERLDKLAHDEQIYDEATDDKAESLIKRRNLNSGNPSTEQPKLTELNQFCDSGSSDAKTTSLKRINQNSQLLSTEQLKETDVEASSSNKRRNSNSLKPSKENLNQTNSKRKLLRLLNDRMRISSIGPILIFAALLIRALQVYYDDVACEFESCAFLAINQEELSKFEICDGKFKNTSVLKLPQDFKTTALWNINVVKVKDVVYVIPFDNFSIKVNLSKSSLTWENVPWNNNYKHYQYIAWENSILAVGNGPLVHILNTTTNTWTNLTSMHESRWGHTLVNYNGLVCAISGYNAPTAECFNVSANQWTTMPELNWKRQFAAAV